KNSVFQMAKNVGMKDHYDTTYAWASALQHGDISGLVGYGQADGNDVEIAPSTRWIRAAQYTAHRGILSILSNYNEVAGHGFDKELGEAKEAFKKCWNA